MPTKAPRPASVLADPEKRRRHVMATATEVPVDERHELVQRFVRENAIALFIQNVLMNEAMPEELLDLAEDFHDRLGVDDLGDTLWPDYDGENESTESLVARAQSDAIVAGMFALLASESAREAFVQTSARLSRIAVRELAKAKVA